MANTIHFVNCMDEKHGKEPTRNSRDSGSFRTIEPERAKSCNMHRLGTHPFAVQGRSAGRPRPGPKPDDELPDFMLNHNLIRKTRPS